ncbi:sugar ABC transporter substrate-binding protein [Thermosynechococcus sp. HN-54]|uniref:ABC transporter substrate-binding protein n=1 Tax=Thermosynechococcus sp. HN-54 TaxID=2933959 RepID=UPI00202CE380|nr:sugar ABC transporter substrate-binding protein [Thermosynechococcus sp. HN-54]URR34383.1 sugar ABC transporter substrate-binding protein [Thermosynechococcus sp. HN-54]
MRQWQRCICGLLVGLWLAILSSCGTAPPTQGIQLEFWTMQLQPKFTDYFNRLIAEFETQHPGVHVRWVDIPWTAMQSKILMAVLAGTAPDVVNLNPDFAALLAGRNAWLNLNDYVPPAVRERYLPNIWQATTLEGKSFAVPWYLTSRVTIYNKAILAAAGVDRPPQTFAELARAAKAVKEKTGKYAFFITMVPEDSAELMQAMVQMGVKLVDDQGRAAFNSPVGKAVFRYWADLYQQGLLPPQVLTEGHRQGIELYQSGQTALLMTSPEFLNTIATNAPSIAAVSAPAPQLTGETGKKNVAVMNLLVPRQSRHPELAVEFALFVTNNENQLAFAKEANVLPSTQAALSDPYFCTVGENATPVDIARAVSASQMSQAEVLIPPLRDIKELQRLLYENLQAVLLGQKTIDQALMDAETAWNSPLG